MVGSPVYDSNVTVLREELLSLLDRVCQPCSILDILKVKDVPRTLPDAFVVRTSLNFVLSAVICSLLHEHLLFLLTLRHKTLLVDVSRLYEDTGRLVLHASCW